MQPAENKKAKEVPMRKPTILMLAAVAGLGLTALALAVRSIAAGDAAVHTAAAQVARGAYLVKIMACNDCHTPWIIGPQGPEPDMTRMLSGHPQDMVMPPLTLGEGPWAWAG